jgi:hypothetical protein
MINCYNEYRPKCCLSSSFWAKLGEKYRKNTPFRTDKTQFCRIILSFCLVENCHFDRNPDVVYRDEVEKSFLTDPSAALGVTNKFK